MHVDYNKPLSPAKIHRKTVSNLTSNYKSERDKQLSPKKKAKPVKVMVANSPNKKAKEVNYGGNTADYWKKIQDAKVQKLTDSHRDMLS
jgi:hypothetical protein